MLLAMPYRTEILLNTGEPESELPLSDSATGARAACAAHEGDLLSWIQPEEGMWEAQGHERRYRVVRSR